MLLVLLVVAATGVLIGLVVVGGLGGNGDIGTIGNQSIAEGGGGGGVVHLVVGWRPRLLSVGHCVRDVGGCKGGSTPRARWRASRGLWTAWVYLSRAILV